MALWKSSCNFHVKIALITYRRTNTNSYVSLITKNSTLVTAGKKESTMISRDCLFFNVRAPQVQKREGKRTSPHVENEIYGASYYLAFNGYYNTIYSVHVNIGNFVINIFTFCYRKKYSLILRTFNAQWRHHWLHFIIVLI